MKHDWGDNSPEIESLQILLSHIEEVKGKTQNPKILSDLDNAMHALRKTIRMLEMESGPHYRF